MAPLSSDPRQILVALNVAKRKALYGLVTEITAYMRHQIELPEEDPGDVPPPLPARHSSNENTPPPAGRTNSGSSVPRSDSAEGFRRQKEDETARAPPPPGLINLRKAALRHFDSWRHEVLGKLKEIVNEADDQKVLDARRKRNEIIAKKQRDEPSEGEDLIDIGNVAPEANAKDPKEKMDSMQHLYHPIPTRLTTIPLLDRKDVLSSMVILLLSIGNYSAYSRALVCYLASALEVSPLFLDREEVEIATTMVETAQKAEAEKNKGGGMSADAEAQKRKESGKVGRYWKVGLASVAGAAIIGVTGGLAAPLVAGAVGGLMGSVGLGGLASFLGVFWMNGALVGTLFGAFGAKMTGEMIDRYAKEVEDFRFLPLAEEWGEHSKQDGPAARRLRVTIGINGWLKEEGDVTRYWRPLGDETEVFALRYEMKCLLDLGITLQELIASYAWSAIKSEILKRTVLATLWGALWPIQIVMMASKVDNPFSLARNRSEKAGKILADALINKVQGERPVTLIGYSLGARVIYYCLREMAERKAFGLIDNVVLMGAPIPSNPGHWHLMRTVVSGKLFNVYSENDYILAFLYRATSAQLGIAGLQPISDHVLGVENIDLSEEVAGHLRYPDLIPKILNRCGFLHVKGGEGEIPKEEDDIQLNNKDFAESGNLIDFEDADHKQKKLEPSKHSLEQMSNEKFDPTVKNVQEPKSDISVKNERLMGAQVAEEHKARMAASPLPEANDPLTTWDAGVNTTQQHQPRDTAYEMNSAPPKYTETEHKSDATDAHEEDSDDEGYGAIRMHDYDDGDMVSVEPLSIEDDYGRK
ncbi:hypothetical protein PFICI_06236 [Pestalotiopsis fici W106-1]|uniref:DUF726 domain-containing protein n=1 Tax=Pestalotiopsis fici (strain W106-1 / CGMCC3.15140) TaxID=1229662 RepID=W3X5G1_PESFW|nr:uncharacterized protein PFICI_06236 [Pestalotiopsis fici W106-1]ETS81234.1 hypothetical protein PFICI_06236 [Pestalotiopsis fici W106-1]